METRLLWENGLHIKIRIIHKMPKHQQQSKENMQK